MKLRWRDHEYLLVTALALLSLGDWSWRLLHDGYAHSLVAFIRGYLGGFLPQAAPVLLLYFCFLWINMRMVPGWLQAAKLIPAGLPFIKRVSLLLKTSPGKTVQVMLMIFLLALVFSIPSRYILLPGRGSGLLRNLYGALLLVVLYAVYISIRELTIDYIERSGDWRQYRISVANLVTTFVVGITLIGRISSLFEITHGMEPVFIFYTLTICSFAIGMINIYWLFPVYGKDGFFKYRLVARLLLSTFACVLLCYFLFSGIQRVMPLFFLWVLQLFIVTPVSWWLYQFQKDKILQLRGMEKELVQSRSDLAFLRAQINPHFLFNVLNTLYGTALQEQADRTAEGIQKLGDMMRFMLHENNLAEIKMSREIEYLENYISLQKLRTALSPGIVIEHDIRAQGCGHLIAPMLLIPFVENAFKHGISLQEASWIRIRLYCDEQHIYFDIGNSVHLRQSNDAEKSASGIGLNNVRERLKWLYPGKYDLEVNSNEKEFLVRLVIHVK